MEYMNSEEGLHTWLDEPSYVYKSGCCNALLRTPLESNNTQIDYICEECGKYVYRFFVYRKK